jgi:hypothetical protein
VKESVACELVLVLIAPCTCQFPLSEHVQQCDVVAQWVQQSRVSSRSLLVLTTDTAAAAVTISIAVAIVVALLSLSCAASKPSGL